MQCSDFLNDCCQRLLNAWACKEFASDTVDVCLLYDSLIKLRDSLDTVAGGFSIDDLPF